MSVEARLQVVHGSFNLDVTLDAPGRGVTAIFGPSGSGKTTLLRAIAGLESGAVGSVVVDEECWLGRDHIVPTHLRGLGFVFQEANLFPHLSVRGNLEYGLKRTPPKLRRFTIDDVAELLGFGALLDRRPARLSGGERQRVAIGRALLAGPRLLLMDEPLASLDLASREDILPFFDRLHQQLEIPMLYVSHALDEVARLADHMVLLDEGKSVASGSVADILTRLDLPIARGTEAQAVVDCCIAGHDDEFDLSALDFEGGRIWVPRDQRAVGSRMRLRVLARDVSLTLEQQSGTSILNIFPATVDTVVEHGPAQVTVRLLIGSTPLLSRITRKSAKTLGIEAGRQLHAQVKSVAVLS